MRYPHRLLWGCKLLAMTWMRVVSQNLYCAWETEAERQEVTCSSKFRPCAPRVTSKAESSRGRWNVSLEVSMKSKSSSNAHHGNSDGNTWQHQKQSSSWFPYFLDNKLFPSTRRKILFSEYFTECLIENPPLTHQSYILRLPETPKIIESSTPYLLDVFVSRIHEKEGLLPLQAQLLRTKSSYDNTL